MKFVRFDAGAGPRVGVLKAGGVVDLLKGFRLHGRSLKISEESGSRYFGEDIDGLIAAGAAGLEHAGRIADIMEPENENIRFLAPLRSPSKIIAVGLNYMDHCREQNIAPPDIPILFSKAPSSLVGPGNPISWPASLTQQVDPEVELGVVIAKRSKALNENQAIDSIFGYTIVNDVSARDIQFGDKQWVRGKSLDTFCPAGPCLVTKDEIPDPQNIRLKCDVNETTWQDSSTREMIFSVRTIIAFITKGITLLPGDLIATGTPHGVGVFQKPPQFLQPGDRIRMEVERIGILENEVLGPT